MQGPIACGHPTSNQTAEQLPTYNPAFSRWRRDCAAGLRELWQTAKTMSNFTTGYFSEGRHRDCALWRRLARYQAESCGGEHGAIGCIIYFDRRGTATTTATISPRGAWRPREGVQRGSVMDTDYPGDPLTPGVGATADAKRLAIEDAKTITKIPVVPISYSDALPLLSALKGPIAPESWRGALAITYHIGPGPAQVHLKVTSNWDLKPLYDVIAVMPWCRRQPVGAARQSSRCVGEWCGRSHRGHGSHDGRGAHAWRTA